jgi:hypothetical protein
MGIEEKAMMKRFGVAIASAVTAAALFSLPGLAQDAEKAKMTTEMDLHVTDLADGMLGPYLDKDEQTLMKSLAYQHAVALNCKGLSVDQAKSQAQLERVFPQAEMDKMTEEQQLAMTTSVMMGFSAIMGGQFAIAAVDYDAYCKAAEADFASKDGSDTHLILVKAP